MAYEASSAEKLFSLLQERGVKSKLQQPHQSIQQKYSTPPSEKWEVVFKPNIEKHLPPQVFHDLVISRMDQPAVIIADDLTEAFSTSSPEKTGRHF